MVTANEESGNPRPSWACESQMRPDKVSGRRHHQHVLPDTNPGSFLTKACSTFLKNQNSRTAISHVFGDPAVFWQDGVLEYQKPLLYIDSVIWPNSTRKCLWEIKPYTISLVKQPWDAICCHPNYSRERFLCHWSLSLHCILLPRSNAKCCLHR